MHRRPPAIKASNGLVFAQSIGDKPFLLAFHCEGSATDTTVLFTNKPIALPTWQFYAPSQAPRYPAVNVLLE